MAFDGVPFAIDARGNFRDVDDVERGEKCGCVCADCKTAVVARHGDIRIHHFAHVSLGECRHAAETGLFGMITSLFESGKTALALPGMGERHNVFPQWREFLSPEDAREFNRTRWIIEPTLVAAGRAIVRSNHISLSRAGEPDIVLPDLSLDVHLLSYRKSQNAAAATVSNSGHAVLAIDIMQFLRLWWEACDPDKEKRINAVSTATAVMVTWLSTHTDGRVLLRHPDYGAKRAAISTWLNERQTAASRAESARIAAEQARNAEILRAAADPGWVAPALTDPAYSREGYRLEAFVKPIKSSITWMTLSVGREFGITWDAEIRRSVFRASGQTSIPLSARQYFDAAEPWQPRYTAGYGRAV